MGITRQGPVHNMDSNVPLPMLPPNKRFTRGQAHRLLKINKVPHDQSAPMEHLLYLLDMHNIKPIAVPPGSLGDEKPVLKVVASNPGLPNNVPKLRVICKENKIPFKREDNKETLIQRITEHFSKNVQNTA